MEIQIREIHDPEVIPQIVDLEVAIWGDPSDTIRPGTMLALLHEGGLLAGAYDQDQLVGFVFGFPTQHPQRHHSHMTGVLETHRGTPAALQLKRFQRDWCLSRGYEQVVWTFDPLRGVNARFNFHKLGITFSQYIPNCYGLMKGINAGAPSDRAYAVWELRSERAYQRIYAPQAEPELEGVPQANTVQREEPLGLELGLEAPRLLFQIPEDWGQILAADPRLALAWRDHSREFFAHYLARGYRAVEFVRHPNRYLLERER